MKKHMDLILLHAPGIYDFRKKSGIIIPEIASATVSASSVFEIPPLGFYNIESYLEAHNISVKIYNLAVMMLRDYRFRAEDLLANLRPKAFGISLHWLIQSQGALKIAEVVRLIHKDIPIIFGGLSASYFYNELIAYPFVDFVIRGNLALYPLEKLMKIIIRKGKDYSKVPNLCYKEKGRAIINPVKRYSRTHFYPVIWNNIKESRNKDVNLVMINPQSGCRYNCCFCGGSGYATRRYSLQAEAVLYKPRKQILKELDSFRAFRSGKNKRLKLITIGHWFDVRGLNTAILDKIKKTNLFSSVHISLFDLMPVKTLRDITKYVSPVIEISPQSHVLGIRKLCHCAGYSNAELESWCEKAADLEIRRIEVYFMIGLPGQTEDSVFDTVDYCERLLKKFKDKKKVIPFLSPLMPFLDPGSLAFENPHKYGYRIFYKTLQEHRESSVLRNFKDRLNYETKWMSRDKIVSVAYRSMIRLVSAKLRHGYLTPNIGQSIISRLEYTLRLLKAIENINLSKGYSPKQPKIDKKIREEIYRYNKEVLGAKFYDQNPSNISINKFWYEI